MRILLQNERPGLAALVCLITIVGFGSLSCYKESLEIPFPRVEMFRIELVEPFTFEVTGRVYVDISAVDSVGFLWRRPDKDGIFCVREYDPNCFSNVSTMYLPVSSLEPVKPGVWEFKYRINGNTPIINQDFTNISQEYKVKSFIVLRNQSVISGSLVNFNLRAFELHHVSAVLKPGTTDSITVSTLVSTSLNVNLLPEVIEYGCIYQDFNQPEVIHLKDNAQSVMGSPVVKQSKYNFSFENPFPSRSKFWAKAFVITNEMGAMDTTYTSQFRIKLN